MRIVADADILAVSESFSGLGELKLVDGRKIDAHTLRNADALLVRSITRVDEKLLSNTPIRFIGSATSGTDHVDRAYLRKHNIEFADAKGGNANAVVEYCFAAFVWIAQEQGFQLQNKQVSLIGVGNVGGQLAHKLRELDVQCAAYDPLLAERDKIDLQEKGVKFVDFAQALKGDIVSFHVPLTRVGNYPTYHQLSHEQMMNLPPGCIMLNTSRGAVLCNSSLKRALKERDDLTVVLDVWEQEPEIDRELLDLVHLGTPHIAGYSVEAKINSTRSLLSQFCDFFGTQIPDEIATGEKWESRQLDVADTNGSHCAQAIFAALPVDEIDRSFRSLLIDSTTQPAEAFDRLRRELAGRREFSAYRIATSRLSGDQKRLLEILGFSVSQR